MAFSPDFAAQSLETSLKQGRLAHAYLITGSPGSGKQKLAERLIESVNPGNPAGFVHFVRPESKSRRIEIKAIRALEGQLHLAAPRNVTKIGVIVDADRLMPQAANAFLKTLEEPPPQSLLLLLTSDPEQLLDTILSRCIKIPLRRTSAPTFTPAEKELLDSLGSLLNEKETEGLAGAWSFLKTFSAILKGQKEAISKQHAATLKEEVAIYRDTTDGDWLKRREEHFKALTESDYIQRRNALVQLLIDWYGDALRHQLGFPQLDLEAYKKETAQTAKRLTQEDILKRLDALEDLRDVLQTNVSENLAYEAAFLAAFS